MTGPQPIGVRVFDVHLPVVAVKKKADGGLEAPKALVYGTAFPILPGLFVTAGHVFNAVQADGIPALGNMGEGGALKVSEITDAEVFSDIDLALVVCPGLEHVPPIPLEFDYQLGLLDPVWTVGFPCALDAEWVTLAPRAFRGSVVTRRESYQLKGQPPCYEVSFPAPEGLSGAPLMSPVLSKVVPPSHRCYGYVIQHATIGSAERNITVGVAVDINAILSIKTEMLNIGPLAPKFGKEPMVFKPTPIKLPGGMKPVDTSPNDWPDDLPDIERDQ